jgi:hypothetical protein
MSAGSHLFLTRPVAVEAVTSSASFAKQICLLKQLSSDAKAHASTEYCLAVKRLISPRCAPQYIQPPWNRGGTKAQRTPPHKQCGAGATAESSNCWFSRRCYRKHEAPWLNPAKFGATESLGSMILGGST